MKTRLFLLTISALCVSAFLLPSPVQAQVNDYQVGALTVTVTGNTTLGAGNSTTESANITVPLAKDLALYVEATGASAAQAGNVTFTFGASVDNTNWDTSYLTVTLPTSGNTTVKDVSTRDIGGIGYLRLYGITNSSNGTISAVKVRYSAK